MAVFIFKIFKIAKILNKIFYALFNLAIQFYQPYSVNLSSWKLLWQIGAKKVQIGQVLTLASFNKRDSKFSAFFSEWGSEVRSP